MSDVAARSSPGGRDGVLKSDVSTRKDQRNPDVKRSAPVRIEQNDTASRHLNVPALGFHSKKNAETGPLGVRFFTARHSGTRNIRRCRCANACSLFQPAGSDHRQLARCVVLRSTIVAGFPWAQGHSLELKCMPAAGLSDHRAHHHRFAAPPQIKRLASAVGLTEPLVGLAQGLSRISRACPAYRQRHLDLGDIHSQDLSWQFHGSI